jgi:excisionase family DNA binding protein
MAKLNHLVDYEPEAEKDPAEELKKALSSLLDFAVKALAPNGNGKGLALREVLTAEELAGRLKLPESTVLEMARLRKLPGAFRVGKHWRFDLDVLRAALPIADGGLDR